MAATKLRTAVTLNTPILNVLAGTDFEFLSQPSLVSFALSGSVDGIRVNIKANNEDLGAEIAPNVEQAVGRVVVAEDTVIDQELLGAGTRLKVAVLSGPAGNLNTFVKVEPIPAGLVG